MSAASVGLRGAQHFASVVGAEAVALNEDEQVVVRPANAHETADCLRLATAEKLTVTPVGGGTCVDSVLAGQRTDVLLDTTGLNRIEQYDPGDLTVRVQAGVTASALLVTLAANGQMLPLDVAGPERATIGGVLATAAHGPMRASFGGVREYCIGIEFAVSDGTLAKAGGMVVKNVAGYDLMKLLIGSYGTLGVITSANFKVFPRPADTATFEARFADSSAACEFVRAVGRSALAPLRLELVSPGALASTADACWTVLLEAAGSDRVVQRYRRDMSTLCPDLHEMEARSAVAIWNEVVDAVPHFRRNTSDAMVLEIMIPLSALGEVCAYMERAARTHGIRLTLHGRAGIGNLIAMIAGRSLAYVNFVWELRERLPKGSQVTVHFAPKEVRGDLAPLTIAPDALNVMRTVRSTLNPNNVLSPGALFA